MSKVQSIIKSDSAKLLKEYILPIYDNDEYVLSAFEAIGREFDTLKTFTDEASLQAWPQFATWSIPYWEDLLGLDIREGVSLEERRRQVLFILSTYSPINPDRVEAIASTIAGHRVVVEQNYRHYAFSLILQQLNDVNFGQMKREINRIKPAHLSARYYLIYDGGLLHLNPGAGHYSFSPIGSFFSGTWVKRSEGTMRIGRIHTQAIAKTGQFSPFISGHLYGNNIESASNSGSAYEGKVNIRVVPKLYIVHFPTGEMICGVYPSISSKGSKSMASVIASVEKVSGIARFPFASQKSYTGMHPEKLASGSKKVERIVLKSTIKSGYSTYPHSGELYGENIKTSSVKGGLAKALVNTQAIAKTGIGRSFPAGVYHCGEVI